MSSISIEKEKVESNFININGDLKLKKKKKSLVLSSALNVFTCLISQCLKQYKKID